MKKKTLSILSILLATVIFGCNISVAATPTPIPTSTQAIPSPTLLVASPTSTTALSLPATLTATFPPPPLPTPTSTVVAGGGVVILPGAPSGPYGVILVTPADVLYIRTAPGAGNPAVGSFAATATTVMRTGRTALVGGAQWVEVQNPSGGNGWVNGNFLTEYVSPAAFCANVAVNNLVMALDTALTTNNGLQLAGLVSPAHGMAVYLWRYGNPIVFEQNDARWVFESTFEHNWGMAPASGLETLGSFHVAVLPFLQEVFNAGYSLTCDSLGTAPQFGGEPWPVLYTNVNYYTVYKPGTPGIDLDFRYFLVGVEFVGGQPTAFSLIHFAWEP